MRHGFTVVAPFPYCRLIDDALKKARQVRAAIETTPCTSDRKPAQFQAHANAVVIANATTGLSIPKCMYALAHCEVDHPLYPRRLAFIVYPFPIATPL